MFKFKLKLLILLVASGFYGCATMPTPKHKIFPFPKEKAFFGDVKRPYQTLGLVRSKATFTSLDPNNEESALCKNYFNKAVRDLVKIAQKQGADAVIDVKSVVFLEDGRRETYPSAECSDDGMEGQVLCQGIAIKWKAPSQNEVIPQEVSQPKVSTQFKAIEDHKLPESNSVKVLSNEDPDLNSDSSLTP